MICKNCHLDYQPPKDLRHFKKDYGFCSVECIEISKGDCLGCGQPMKRRANEPMNEFVDRVYCTQS